MRLERIIFVMCLLVLSTTGKCTSTGADIDVVDEPAVDVVVPEPERLAEPAIDAVLPAGNIVFEKMSGDTVYVHQEIRDTQEDWFYWALRARGCQGRTITFMFTRSVAVGVRGPVASFDQGRTFGYVDARDITRHKFTFTFPHDAYEVWMYECFPYYPEMWESFVQGIPATVKYDTGTLCQSRKGVDVPFFHIGEGKHKVVMTSRHHASEATGTMVIEGVAAAFAEDSEFGRLLRSTIDLTIIPFVDIDGVIAGDQGKSRKPHDHNRDYDQYIYPETKAISKLMEKKTPILAMDVHGPWLYGKYNEFIYTPMKDPKIIHDIEKEARFSALIEKDQEGGLRYKASDDLPYGQAWNGTSNYKAGSSFVVWSLKNIPSLEICRSLEVPFANANGAVVTPQALKQFGHGLAKAILDIITEE